MVLIEVSTQSRDQFVDITALNAWLCVDTLTFSTIARCVRKALASASLGSPSARRPWLANSSQRDRLWNHYWGQVTVQTSGKVNITGLEQPVLVRQVDDRKVELCINYSMTMELSNQAIDSDKE